MKASLLPRFAASVAIIGILAACGATGVGEDGPTDAGSSPPAASRPPFETAPPSSTAPSAEAPAGVPDEVWNAILAALDEELGGVRAPDVDLVSVDETTWNDGSLGCPQPGAVYTQALVDGVRVVVEIDGTEYDYRVPRGGQPVLCD